MEREAPLASVADQAETAADMVFGADDTIAGPTTQPLGPASTLADIDRYLGEADVASYRASGMTMGDLIAGTEGYHPAVVNVTGFDSIPDLRPVVVDGFAPEIGPKTHVLIREPGTGFQVQQAIE